MCIAVSGLSVHNGHQCSFCIWCQVRTSAVRSQCWMNESINHLFLACPLSRFIRNVVGYAFGLTCPPADIHQLMTKWIGGFGRRTRKLILVGLIAVVWNIWIARNSACFKQKWPSEPVQVIFDICRCIELWAKMRKEADQDLLVKGAKVLSQVAIEVFGAGRRWTPWIKKLKEGAWSRL